MPLTEKIVIEFSHKRQERGRGCFGLLRPYAGEQARQEKDKGDDHNLNVVFHRVVSKVSI